MNNDKLTQALIEELNKNTFNKDGVYLEFPFWCIAVFTSNNIGIGKYIFEGYFTKFHKVAGETYMGCANRISLKSDKTLDKQQHLDSALNYLKKFKTQQAAEAFCERTSESFLMYELKPVYVESIVDLGWQELDK